MWFLIRMTNLSIPVKAGDILRLIGFYEPLQSTKKIKKDPLLKNEIILNYIRNLTAKQ